MDSADTMIVPDGWVVHDERRMHDPALRNVCAGCLRAALAELLAAAEAADGSDGPLAEAAARARQVLHSFPVSAGS